MYWIFLFQAKVKIAEEPEIENREKKAFTRCKLIIYFIRNKNLLTVLFNNKHTITVLTLVNIENINLLFSCLGLILQSFGLVTTGLTRFVQLLYCIFMFLTLAFSHLRRKTDSSLLDGFPLLFREKSLFLLSNLR
jgi:hypothetical protein